MIRKLACGTLCFAALLGAADSEWKSLFDGKTTAGWLEVTGKPVPAGSWRVEDGCLRAIQGNEGMQDIRTVDVYRNFEFEFEWKIEAKGNSGVKYLLQKADEWTPNAARGRQARARGLEYQLADDNDPEAAASPKQTTGAVYAAIAPAAHVPAPLGVFNRSRIIVRGRHAEHWLNGTRVVEFSLDDPAVAAQIKVLLPKNGVSQFPDGSPICLQNHGTPAWFRNLRIRRLD